MASPSTDKAFSEGPLWEVFAQEKEGGPHVHVGSVHAPDAELALQNARDVYARRGHPLSLWVVPFESITASQPKDAPSFFDPADDKLYRHPRFYTVPRAVKGVQVEDRAHRFECLLRAADDRLILGHRLSEWCGHAPILEEELALANVALDLLGQAQRLYERASKFDEGGRNPDALVFLRDADAYRNAVLVEQPNGDFAATIVRQYLFDVYNRLFLSALSESDDAELVEFAGGALKEATFHERHSRSWLMRLGDGTEESHRRMQTAVDGLWRFTGELFAVDPISEAAARAGWWPDLRKLTEPWRAEVERTCREATLELPEAGNSVAVDGRSGRHTEHLALLLAEMQVLARAEPDAQW